MLFVVHQEKETFLGHNLWHFKQNLPDTSGELTPGCSFLSIVYERSETWLAQI